MRSWLRRTFGKPDLSRELEKLRAKLESFTRPSLALVDTRTLTIPAERERYATFLLGAAGALAESRGLGETEALAVLVMYLRGARKMQEQEVSHLVGRAMTRAAEPEGQPDHDAGAEAMAEWLEGDPGTAVRRLAEVLR